MNLPLKNIQGEKIGDVSVPDILIKSNQNENAVRQAVLAEMVNLRQGTHSTKNRSLVRGGGKKPWKQKGRGAARAGTIRSPLWRGGGAVFGPSPHRYRHKVSKKLSLLARKSVFIEKIKNNRILVVDSLVLEKGKTDFFKKCLSKYGIEHDKITLLVSSSNNNLTRATSNLSNIYLVNVNCVSIYEMLDCKYILLDEQGYNTLIEILTR